MVNEQLYIQCNLNLVTLNLVTIYKLVAILKKDVSICCINSITFNTWFRDSFFERPIVSLNQECTVLEILMGHWHQSKHLKTVYPCVMPWVNIAFDNFPIE